MEQRVIEGVGSANMLRPHCIAAVEMKSMVGCEPAGDGRFAGAASASDPANVSQSSAQKVR